MTSLELAKDPNTDPKILEKLSYDEDWGVRYNVAKNPNTPPEILDRLSYDEFWSVRLLVTQNPNTSPETLDRLYDYESRVFFFGIPNRSFNLQTYDEFKTFNFLDKIIINPNTPQYIKDHFRFKNFIGNYT